MAQLEASATKYLSRLPQGDAERYIAGGIPVTKRAPRKKDAPKEAHHAGQEVALTASRPMTLGEMLLRPADGALPAPELITVPGTDKRTWLSWDGHHAHITGLDDYVLNHRRRMKPCTSFDKLTYDSGENQLFGNAAHDFVHFDPVIGEAIAELADAYPAEVAEYAAAFRGCITPELPDMLRLIDPMCFIADGRGKKAAHFRIRVGASDADTAFSISAALALKLQEHCDSTVEYALVWDQPHSQADYPGELTEWIHRL